MKNVEVLEKYKEVFDMEEFKSLSTHDQEIIYLLCEYHERKAKNKKALSTLRR